MSDLSSDNQFLRLLAEARQGSADAAGELIDGFRPYLLLIANTDLNEDVRGKVGPSDIVQNALISAQRAIGDFQGDSSEEFRRWLRGILHNDILVTYRRYRTAKREIQREVSARESVVQRQVGDAHDTPSQNAVRKEEAQALRDALERLTPEYRQVLELRNWQDLSFPEIGEHMQRSAEAVRKLWARAVLQLQRELENEPSSGQSSGVKRSR